MTYYWTCWSDIKLRVTNNSKKIFPVDEYFLSSQATWRGWINFNSKRGKSKIRKLTGKCGGEEPHKWAFYSNGRPPSSLLHIMQKIELDATSPPYKPSLLCLTRLQTSLSNPLTHTHQYYSCADDGIPKALHAGAVLFPFATPYSSRVRSRWGQVMVCPDAAPGAVRVFPWPEH